MKRWAALALDLIFPCYCVSCGIPVLSGENFLCRECRKTLRPAGKGCPVCSHPLNNAKCGFCSTRRFYPEKHISIFEYDGAAKSIVYALKFGGIKNVYRIFIPYMVRSLEKFGRDIDVITSVPMNRKKYAARGYNQSELLAKSVSSVAGIPFMRLLREKGNSIPQREFSFASRYINVIDRYETLSNNKLIDKTILLIDDVFTTGATVNECSRQLLNSGAHAVFSLTVARSDLKKLENI